ncbi:J domain-containing protein [Dubosiella newyorkensis]|uniref:J domain-containing protein n=1 Tax=Dubosiella newyorkensis TaxID=1862672 RepID=UPI00272FB5C4|nr:DnaJ domain-containing protein [Dubosiella newyorkensis]
MEHKIRKQEDLYKRYVRLLLEKEKIVKTNFQVQQRFIELFGDLRLEMLKVEIEIAKIKKEMEYLVRKKNRNESYDLEEMDDFVNQALEGMKAQYERMKEEQAQLKNKKMLSQEEVKEVKRLYRRLVKLVHPDLNPHQTKEQKELWHQLQKAYRNNDLAWLRELNVLIVLKTKGHEEVEIEDLEDKIEAVREEIALLKEEDLYQMRELVFDEEWIDAYKEQYERERSDFEVYLRSLQKEKEKLIGSFGCRLN